MIDETSGAAVQSLYAPESRRVMSEENASKINLVCANLRALTDQVRMLEEMPLIAEPLS